MRGLPRTLGVLFAGLLGAAASLYGYSVVYLLASQPGNHGQLRFKAYAGACLLSFLLSGGLTLWGFAKVWPPKGPPGPRRPRDRP